MHPLVRCARAANATTAAKLPRCCTRPSIVTRSHQPLLHQQQRQIQRRTFTFTTSSPMASPSTAQINFSPGVDETALTKALQPLLASAGEGGRWAVVPGGEGLERSFKFKTFAKTWDFMTAVSLQCKLKNHHPEWSNVYNTTYIRWTTHSPKGLSAKDVELAAACDGLARDFGEIVEDEEDGGATRELKQVADRVVANAGDCCAPKK